MCSVWALSGRPVRPRLSPGEQAEGQGTHISTQIHSFWPPAVPHLHLWGACPDPQSTHLSQKNPRRAPQARGGLPAEDTQRSAEGLLSAGLARLQEPAFEPCPHHSARGMHLQRQAYGGDDDKGGRTLLKPIPVLSTRSIPPDSAPAV